MLQFKPITIQDRDDFFAFSSFFSSTQNCDFSFMNICSWQFLYKSEYAIYENFLIVRFITDNHLAYMFPIGNGDLHSILKIMEDDAKSQNHAFFLFGITSQQADFLNKSFPEKFKITPDRNYFDYIYLRDDLIQLKGKKLQAKRNHVNHFKNEYDYEYLPLTSSLIPDCLGLEKIWRKDNPDLDPKSLECEYQSMIFALQHLDELNGIGGVLKIQNRVVAFTYGTPINENTFAVHVEKADARYNGIYPTINQLFVEHIPSQYTYINREEDLGIDGLRKSKLSYQPAYLLEKYIAIRRHHYCQLDPVTQQLKQLWKECFEDEESFVSLFFSKIYQKENVIMKEINDKVVSALHVIPYEFKYKDEICPISYIYAACTAKNYRNQGLMSNVLQMAFKKLWLRKKTFVSLIPASESLFHFYENFGFTTCFSYSERLYTKDSIINKAFTTNNRTILIESAANSETIFQYIRKKEENEAFSILHSQKQIEVILQDLQNENGCIAVNYTNDEITGLAFVVLKDCEIHIRKAFYDQTDILEAMIKSLFEKYTDKEVIHLCFDNDANKRGYGMVRIIHLPSALSIYAKEHPDIHQIIEIKDPDISENVGVYKISNGNWFQLSNDITSKENIIKLSITDFCLVFFNINTFENIGKNNDLIQNNHNDLLYEMYD